uniref:Uncharacterized protein n=1 Tax=Leersia perrieri TaxID=77586 RepID=A0A0D9XU47_9ORYZ
MASKLRLSQENVDWILARSELCTDDAPDIARYIPFLVQAGDGVEEPLPEAYYGNPKSLMRHIDRLLMEKFPKFRDFQRWVRDEHDRDGFVEVEYDYHQFERTQREREQRRGMMAELLADVLPTFEDGDFGEYEEVYDEERREFILREVRGISGVPVFDKDKKMFVFVNKD